MIMAQGVKLSTTPCAITTCLIFVTFTYFGTYLGEELSDIQESSDGEGLRARGVQMKSNTEQGVHQLDVMVVTEASDVQNLMLYGLPSLEKYVAGIVLG